MTDALFAAAVVATVASVIALILAPEIIADRRHTHPDRATHIAEMEHDLGMHSTSPEDDCDQCCWSAGRLAPPRADWQKR